MFFIAFGSIDIVFNAKRFFFYTVLLKNTSQISIVSSTIFQIIVQIAEYGHIFKNKCKRKQEIQLKFFSIMQKFFFSIITYGCLGCSWFNAISI